MPTYLPPFDDRKGCRATKKLKRQEQEQELDEYYEKQVNARFDRMDKLTREDDGLWK